MGRISPTLQFEIQGGREGILGAIRMPSQVSWTGAQVIGQGGLSPESPFKYTPYGVVLYVLT